MRGYALPAEADERRITAAADPEDAFDALYRAYAPALRAYCQARLRNPVDAEDACHEAIIRAHAALPRFKRGQRLWPWLATIAGNVCRDMQRRQATVAAHTTRVDVVVDDLDELAAARTRRAILVDALAGMPERYRSHVRLCDLEGFSYSEVAALDGTTVASVRSTLHRARSVLRERVRDTAHRRHQWPLPAFVPLGFSRLRARLARTRATAAPVAEPIGRLDALLGFVANPVLAQGVFSVAAMLGVGLGVVADHYADDDVVMANASSFAADDASSSAVVPGATGIAGSDHAWVANADRNGSAIATTSDPSLPGFSAPGDTTASAAAPDAPVVYLSPSSPSAPQPYVPNVSAPASSSPPSPVQMTSAPEVTTPIDGSGSAYNATLPSATVDVPTGPEPVDPGGVNIEQPTCSDSEVGLVGSVVCAGESSQAPELDEPELDEPNVEVTLTA